MEINPDQSLGNKENLENQQKSQQSSDMETEDSDSINKLEDDGHPVRDKIVNEKKSQRNYKISAKDFLAMTRGTMYWKRVEEDEQDRRRTDRDEFRKKILEYFNSKN